MKKIVAAILMIFVCGLSYARIGETLAQCIERYGQPFGQDESTKAWVFQKAGLNIAIRFFEDKADVIQFEKTEKNILQRSEKLSENEIQILLVPNGLGHKWKKRDDVISMDTIWQTDDRKITAWYDDISCLLTIATKDWQDREAVTKKASEEKQLSGF